MKRLLLALLLFCSPALAETNDLDKTFLDIALSCKTFRIFDSQDKSQEVETNCIRTKLKENNLSKAKYNKWSKDYYKYQKEVWDNFFKNLEENK
tara:strand:- start:357 stop:638 length:282 start_codon:yes stop_codon:yes gene_type:complete